jgi:hypothetical protein
LVDAILEHQGRFTHLGGMPGHDPEPVADFPAGRTILGLIAAGSASRLGPADALEWHTD